MHSTAGAPSELRSTACTDSARYVWRLNCVTMLLIVSWQNHSAAAHVSTLHPASCVEMSCLGFLQTLPCITHVLCCACRLPACRNYSLNVPLQDNIADAAYVHLFEQVGA